MEDGNMKLIITGLVCLCMSTLITTANAAATVTLTSDVSAVAAGGSITFTVTVTPGDHVTKVILAYEGESGQDEDTTSPYVFSHQFETPTDGLTVTATVQYDNNDPDGQDTLNVNVVGLKITGSTTPLRAMSATYLAQSDPTGKAIDQFNWTYQWSQGSNTYQDDDSNGDDKSIWSGKMVVSGTLTCSATVAGVSVQKSLSIAVQPRNWTVPITCAQDNETDWGEEPEPEATLGQNRDRDSDLPDRIFVPQGPGHDFSGARTLTQVPSGPCSGLWYVYNSTLKCQRETVISRYIKNGGPLPAGASANFYDINDSGCFAQASSSAANFVLAVAHHEYRGTPETFKSEEGHQGRLEKAIIDSNLTLDPKAAIEPLVNLDADDLAAAVDEAIIGCQAEVSIREADDGEVERNGPNWGYGIDALGSGGNSRWEPATSSWTECFNGPMQF
jgi:hypothetical protein